MERFDWTSLAPGDGLIMTAPSGKLREATVTAARADGLRVSYDGFDAKHDEDLSLADADARVLQGPRPDAATVARLVAAAAAARGAAPARGEVCAICCVGDDDASDESDDGDDGALFAHAACAKQRAAAARAEEEGPPRNKLNDELVEPKAFVRLECGHAFHRLCVLPWLAKHRTCPTCRARVERAGAARLLAAPGEVVVELEVMGASVPFALALGRLVGGGGAAAGGAAAGGGAASAATPPDGAIRGGPPLSVDGLRRLAIWRFEAQHGGDEMAAAVAERCKSSEPKHGELWQRVSKRVVNWHDDSVTLLKKCVAEMGVGEV